MGWKLSSIIVNPVTNVNPEDLLNKLGFKNLVKLSDQPFEDAMNPQQGTVYIGTYKDNLIICADNLPQNFFDGSLSKSEEVLISYFPNSEICALSLQSTTSLFGFALIKNGEKIRVKAGDLDKGTTIDFGEPLQEEKELLSKSKVDSTGQRLYYLGNSSDEAYLESQVGENFVFNLFSRYTGLPLDEDDELLDTKFTGYKFSPGHVSPDQYFSGQWDGEYSYGDGYSEKVKGTKENFTLNLTVTDGELKGVCIDQNKQSDEPAVIQGFLFGTFIGFIKEYPVRYVIDDQGITHKRTAKSPFNIAYSGLYDVLTDSFKGVWTIKNKKFWGEWTIKRKKQSDSPT
jgi:hypothetical protein